MRVSRHEERCDFSTTDNGHAAVPTTKPSDGTFPRKLKRASSAHKLRPLKDEDDSPGNAASDPIPVPAIKMGAPHTPLTDMTPPYTPSPPALQLNAPRKSSNATTNIVSTADQHDSGFRSPTPPNTRCDDGVLRPAIPVFEVASTMQYIYIYIYIFKYIRGRVALIWPIHSVALIAQHHTSSSNSSSTASTASSKDATKLPDSIPEEKPMAKIDLKNIKSIGNYNVGCKLGEVSK